MRVAMLGAGVMGTNIARVLAGAGLEVTLSSRSERTLAFARAALMDAGVREVGFETSVERATDGVGLVVESVPESLEIKREVLGLVSGLVDQNAVIATNTSSLPLSQIVEAVAAPERFLGWHWFNPAHLMPLVEVIPAAETLPGVVNWSLELLRSAGKRPTLAPAIDGFLANRLQYALIREALALVDAGLATPQQVDAAVTDCLGPRWAVIGPMRSTDLAGVPTALAVAGQLYPQLSDADAPQEVLSALAREGRLGAAAGRGFYEYPDPAAAAAERDRKLRAVLQALER
jgi:3-hydroxybutyryl-CoA dehydrogenase